MRLSIFSSFFTKLNKLHRTKELLAVITQWEEKHGEFRYGGESYSERVNEQDESYFEIRDSLRNARRKKDGKPEVKASIRKASMVNSAAGVKVLLCSQDLNASSFSTASTSYSDIENSAPAERNSTGSDLTEYTSVTEIKERQSTLTSCTVKKI